MYLLVCACARTLTVETRACALVTSPQCVRSTLYVTRAPCPRCHCLIAAAGIRRVVAPTDLETEACVVSAEEFGIEMVKLRDAPPRKAWRDGLAEKHRDNDAILAARLMRKKLKKDKKSLALANKLHAGWDEKTNDTTVAL